jgi:16S rRNA (uracil1498-N3)-methyltransferase
MLPLFFSEELKGETNQCTVFDEDTSRHIVQVLRMRKAGILQVTNGNGGLYTGEIVDDNKKAVKVGLSNFTQLESPDKKATICLSLLKNTNRFEWFLEKASELGVFQIIPMICDRTERQHFRMNRMRNILVSAMLQSRQCWLPDLPEPQPFQQIVEEARQEQKMIAHCINEKKLSLAQAMNRNISSHIMLVGPEGDFTQQEVAFAIEAGFVGTSLGESRLRSETAALIAATIIQLG